jgi:photosystem II stability/assembly factor-like uncharacterized protein
LLSYTKSRKAGKTLIQILFFFSLLTQICFAQWVQQTSGTTANSNAVHFENTTDGWAVGDSGIILHTTNSGQDWITQLSGTENPLHDLYFINEEVGWVVGGQGGTAASILHTTDGGTTWTSQISGMSCILTGVSFINESTGWVVGSAGDGSGIILHTTNGGIIWISYEQDEIKFGFWYNKVCFRNENEGIVSCNLSLVGPYCCCGFVERTTDGGMTWDTVSALPENKMNGISFIDSNTGWVVGDCEVIYKTTNGGLDWIAQHSGDIETVLFSVCFTDENNGTAVGVNYEPGEVATATIYRTIDGGQNWLSQPSGITDKSLRGVSFTDANNGWAVGDGGIIIRTTNGGVNFIEDEVDHPREFSLSQNQPNPFNPSTKIKYSIPQSSNVELKVFDILGNEIETLVSEERPAGIYEITWYAESLPSGVYFYRLQADELIETKKMLFLK